MTRDIPPSTARGRYARAKEELRTELSIPAGSDDRAGAVP